MLRIILVSTVLLALVACGQDNSAKQQDTAQTVPKDKAHSQVNHKDMEHHDAQQEDGHEPHADHGDKEHHSSTTSDSHEHGAEHKDDEHHSSGKSPEHTEHEEHKDEEHHASGIEASHADHNDHEDKEHHVSGNNADHSEHAEHGDKEHHAKDQKESHSGHGHEGEESGHEEEGTVHLKPEQLKAANIVVKPLALTEVAARIRAPGEIKLNAYRTVNVSPRINAQVIARHARLGDEVIQGQALVTLSSVEMAEAQGLLLLADKEWKRVKKLGRKVVSERRYITSKVEYEKSYANAKAYGMTESEIKDLLNQKRSADGSFKLVAQQAGRVLHDEFIIGQRVEAGFKLMTISDESVMWVEAHVNPVDAGKISIGNSAEVLFNEQRTPAKVIQLHHTLDEITRTTAIRLEIDNKEDRLHGGMFVTVFITTHDKSKAIQIPEAAVLRSPDGDWQVMVEQDEAGEFKAVEVKLVGVSEGVAVIQGLKPGTRVITQGAFFVQSELAKSGFDIHNH
ncbi:Probable Co/Zn/Cd efflux system membrane fusion protein [hydrothermal vent metagenome]|uniref:Probable Co/Zn/Cd efflux system membrane fusion protein n=1 Tax=hydrothermal vent metagenome TaxID=652676 RepID=A0A3B0ZGI3_9ZZZZ